MARQLKLDELNRNTVVALVSAGMSQRQAAMHVGCDASTVTKLATRDEAFAEQLRAARRRAQQEPLELIKKHAERSWRAAAWLLEKSHPHLYGKQAGKVSEQALEEQRIELVQILADEIGDAELLDRIIDRLHQFDEAKLPPVEDAVPPEEQPVKDDRTSAEVCVPQQDAAALDATPPQETCASQTISACQPTAPVAKVESNGSPPGTKACAKKPRTFDLAHCNELGKLYAQRSPHAVKPPCAKPMSQLRRWPHLQRRGRQKRPGRR